MDIGSFWRNTNLWQKMGIFAIPVVMILIVIIFLVSVLNKPQEITSIPDHIIIENYTLLGADTSYQPLLQDRVWSALQYSNTPAETITGATIRDGASITKDGVLTTAQFLLDIPDLRQTFSVSFSWPTDSKVTSEDSNVNYMVSVNCPNYQDVIYPETTCQASNNYFDILSQYLPTNLPAGETVELFLSSGIYNQYDNNTGEQYLIVDYLTCDESENYSNMVKNRVNSWLEERYINPARIYIEYYPHCGRVELVSGDDDV